MNDRRKNMNPELTLKDDEWAIFRLRMLYRQYG